MFSCLTGSRPHHSPVPSSRWKKTTTRKISKFENHRRWAAYRRSHRPCRCCWKTAKCNCSEPEVRNREVWNTFASLQRPWSGPIPIRVCYRKHQRPFYTIPNPIDHPLSLGKLWKPCNNWKNAKLVCESYDFAKEEEEETTPRLHRQPQIVEVLRAAVV